MVETPRARRAFWIASCLIARMTSKLGHGVPPLVLGVLLASACSGPADSAPPDGGPAGACEGPIACCEDVAAEGSSTDDPAAPPFTYDAPPDLVEGDDAALADGAFDATWTAVRAGSGGTGSELVLDRDGDEIVLAFPRPLEGFPALATGTTVRVERPHADANGVWIRDASGATIALVTERGRDLAVGPFELEATTPPDCLVPTYVWAPGTGWCWIGAYRYDARIGGKQLALGAATSIDLDGTAFDVTLHRLQIQDGIVTSSGMPGCAPRVLDELVIEAWRSQ